MLCARKDVQNINARRSIKGPTKAQSTEGLFEPAVGAKACRNKTCRVYRDIHLALIFASGGIYCTAPYHLLIIFVLGEPC